MRLLLVEDEESKRQRVAEVLRVELPDAEIVEARSLNSGLKTVVQGNYDLVILDMTMPTFDITELEEGGRPQAYGGRELLRHMERRGIEVPTVLLTQFDRFGKGTDQRSIEELDVELRSAYPRTYRGVIRYNVAFDSWREELVSILIELKDS
jgi:CheY-like chemotaxis protein